MREENLSPAGISALEEAAALAPPVAPSAEPLIPAERIGIPSVFGPAPEGSIARPIEPSAYEEIIAPRFTVGPSGERVPVPEQVRAEQLARYAEASGPQKEGAPPLIPAIGSDFVSQYSKALPIAQRAELARDIAAQSAPVGLALGAGAEIANVLGGFGILPAATGFVAEKAGATGLAQAMADYSAFQKAVEEQRFVSAVGAGRLIGGAVPFILSGGATAVEGAGARAATVVPRIVTAVGERVEKAVGASLGEAVQARAGAALAGEVALGNISEAAADTAAKMVGAGARAGLRMGSEMLGIGVAQEAAQQIEDREISIPSLAAAGAYSFLTGVGLGAVFGTAGAAARVGVSEVRGRTGNALAAAYRKHMPVLGGVQDVDVPKAIKLIKPDLKSMSGEEIVESFNPANWRDAAVQQNRYDVLYQDKIRKQVTEDISSSLDDMFKADKESAKSAAVRNSLVAEKIPANLRGRVAVQANHVLDAVDEIVGNRMLRGVMGKQLEGEVNLAAKEISTAGERAKFDNSAAYDIADYVAETRKNLGDYLARFRAKAEEMVEQSMWDKMPDSVRNRMRASVAEYNNLQASLDDMIMSGDQAGYKRAVERMDALQPDIDAVNSARTAAFREPDITIQPSQEVTGEIARRLMTLKAMVGSAVDRLKAKPDIIRTPEQNNTLRALGPIYGLLKDTVESADVFGKEAVDMLSESGSKYAAKMDAQKRLFDRLGVKRAAKGGGKSYEIAMGKLRSSLKNMSNVENAPVFAALKDYLDADVANQEARVRLFGADDAAYKKALQSSERAKIALDRGADLMYKVHQAEALRSVDKESKLLKPGSRLSLPSLLGLAGFKTAGPYGAVAGGVSGQMLATGAQVVASPYKSMQVIGAFRERSNRVRDMFQAGTEDFLRGKTSSPSALRRSSESLYARTGIFSGNRQQEDIQANAILRKIVESTSTPQRLDAAVAAGTADIGATNPEVASDVADKMRTLLDRLRTAVPPRLIDGAEDLPAFVDRRLIWSPERRKGFIMSREERVKFITDMRAAFDPMGTIASWTRTGASRSSIDAIRRFHPELYEEVRRQVMLTSIKISDEYKSQNKRLSYRRRLQLGTMFDIPTDVSLRPDMIDALQSTYAAQGEGGTGESGGGGGTQLRRKLNVSTEVETEAQATERGSQ